MSHIAPRYTTFPFLTFSETSCVKFLVRQTAGNSGDTLGKMKHDKYSAHYPA